jgi:hypothetical protein
MLQKSKLALGGPLDHPTCRLELESPASAVTLLGCSNDTTLPHFMWPHTCILTSTHFIDVADQMIRSCKQRHAWLGIWSRCLKPLELLCAEVQRCTLPNAGIAVSIIGQLTTMQVRHQDKMVSIIVQHTPTHQQTGLCKGQAKCKQSRSAIDTPGRQLFSQQRT